MPYKLGYPRGQTAFVAPFSRSHAPRGNAVSTALRCYGATAPSVAARCLSPVLFHDAAICLNQDFPPRSHAPRGNAVSTALRCYGATAPSVAARCLSSLLFHDAAICLNQDFPPRSHALRGNACRDRSAVTRRDSGITKQHRTRLLCHSQRRYASTMLSTSRAVAPQGDCIPTRRVGTRRG